MSPTLKILSGIAGSGKTTYAKTHESAGDLYLGRDEWRAALRKERNTTDYFPVPFAEERRLWHEYLATAIAASSADTIIIDQTTLSTKALETLLGGLAANGIRLSRYNIEIMRIHVSLQTAKMRNAQRRGYARVPDEIIDRMYRSFCRGIKSPKNFHVTITDIDND